MRNPSDLYFTGVSLFVRGDLNILTLLVFNIQVVQNFQRVF